MYFKNFRIPLKDVPDGELFIDREKKYEKEGNKGIDYQKNTKTYSINKKVKYLFDPYFMPANTIRASDGEIKFQMQKSTVFIMETDYIWGYFYLPLLEYLYDQNPKLFN
jgi:hypothetical protein